MRGLPSRRLLVAALAAGVALTALAVAQAGLAAAAGPQAPDQLVVPPPRLGDAGTYVASFTGDWPSGWDVPAEAYRFAWQAGQDIRDADGAVTPTDALATSERAPTMGHRHSPAWDNATVLYAAGTPQAVAELASGQGRQQESAPGPVPLAPGLLGTQTQASGELALTFYGIPPSCALSGATAGTYKAGDAMPLAGRCSFFGFPANGTGLVADRWEPWQGTFALHVAGNLSAPDTLELWFVPGLPVPVQARWHQDHGIDVEAPASVDAAPVVTKVGPRTATWVLAAFEAGKQPRTVRPAGPAPDPLADAPRQAWGPDDSGVAAPYPLSTAFQRARDDLRFSGLRDFLKAHPKAVVQQAMRQDVTFDDRRSLGWDLVLGDRTAGFFLQAEHDVNQRVAGVDPQAAEALAQDSYMGQAIAGSFRPIDADNAPARLPTVASLMDRWSLYAGAPPSDGNAWSLDLECLDTNCSRTAAALDVGRDDAQFWSDRLNGTSLQTGVDHHMAVLQTVDGQVGAFYAARGSATIDEGLSPATPVASSGHLDLQAAGVHVASGLSLPPVATVGLGVLAVLGSALYWLWPAIKGGPLALFSRLREPELATHPIRRRILDAIAVEPGVHFAELRRRTALPNGSLVHHLGALERGGLVAVRHAGGYACHFLADSGADPRRAASTKADGARQLLDAVRSHPGLSGLELAHLTGLQPSTVAYHAQRLADAGLVERRRDGRALRLHPAGAA